MGEGPPVSKPRTCRVPRLCKRTMITDLANDHASFDSQRSCSQSGLSSTPLSLACSATSTTSFFPRACLCDIRKARGSFVAASDSSTEALIVNKPPQDIFIKTQRGLAKFCSTKRLSRLQHAVQSFHLSGHSPVTMLLRSYSSHHLDRYLLQSYQLSKSTTSRP